MDSYAKHCRRPSQRLIERPIGATVGQVCCGKDLCGFSSRGGFRLHGPGRHPAPREAILPVKVWAARCAPVLQVIVGGRVVVAALAVGHVPVADSDAYLAAALAEELRAQPRDAPPAGCAGPRLVEDVTARHQLCCTLLRGHVEPL